MSSDKPETPHPPKAPRKRGRWRRGRVGCLLLVAGSIALPAAIYVLILSREIGSTFEGRLWTTPSRVYSAPLTVEAGQRISIRRIQERLQHCNYANVYGSPQPGQYRISGPTLEVYTREFPMPGNPWPARRLRFTIKGGRVSSIVSLSGGRPLRAAQIEPESIVSFYGA